MAVKHLAALITRTDGVALRNIADPKGAAQVYEADFVVDRTAQTQLYGLLTAALTVVTP